MSNLISIEGKRGESDAALNDEVSEMLGRLTQLAHDGKLIGIAFAGCTAAGDLVSGHTVGSLNFALLGALETKKAQLVAIMNEDDE